VAAQIDTAVIGKVMGTEKLGYYVLAFTFAAMATTSISKHISSIMLPAYSKLQSDKIALKAAFLKTLKFISLIIFPIMVGIIITAEPIVLVVFGDKWSESIAPLQILVIFGILRSLSAINGYLFEGIGKPKLAFQLAFLRMIILVILIVPTAKSYGLEGIALLITLGIGIQWIMGLFLLRSNIGATINDIALAIYPALWRSGLMGALVFTVGQYTESSQLINLIISVVVGILTYGTLTARTLIKIGRVK
jgi:PST family polysaccharide transporter/lipopolysaccharide exporter